MAFVHTTESVYKFPLGYHLRLKSHADVAMNVRVFKWQADQVISSMSKSRIPTETHDRDLKMKRAKSLESLFASKRSESKRLRLAMTDDGCAF